jgi:hypothetical protein
MCLIVDANVATLTFANPPDPNFEPVNSALFRGQAKIVYGGQLATELLKVASVRAALKTLDRAGRVTQIQDRRLAPVEKALRASNQCTSNDVHIIALAQVSGVRLLCTRDQPLHRDFTNKSLLSDPRGKIYQNPAHAGLIRKHCRP